MSGRPVCPVMSGNVSVRSCPERCPECCPMCPKLCPVCPAHSGHDHASPCPVLSDMAPIGTIRPAVQQLLGVGHCKITVGLSDHCGYLSCETCVLRDDRGHERVYVTQSYPCHRGTTHSYHRPLQQSMTFSPPHDHKC